MTRPSPNLTDLLENYEPFNEIETIYVKQLKQFLSETNNPYDRSNLIAHVAADAWVLNQDHSKVLLVEHAACGEWVAPGGHCDGDPDVYANAVREVEEETGLAAIKPLHNRLFDINVGYVPARQKSHGIEPDHLHFDVCFVFIGDETQPLKISDESLDLKWVPVTEIPNIKFMECHLRRYEKTLAGWGLK